MLTFLLDSYDWKKISIFVASGCSTSTIEFSTTNYIIKTTYQLITELLHQLSFNWIITSAEYDLHFQFSDIFCYRLFPVISYAMFLIHIVTMNMFDMHHCSSNLCCISLWLLMVVSSTCLHMPVLATWSTAIWELHGNMGRDDVDNQYSMQYRL